MMKNGFFYFGIFSLVSKVFKFCLKIDDVIKCTHDCNKSQN